MRPLLPLRLVIREVRYEWLSSFCLCVAIAAAIIPLLMVLGLKDGTVATLRERLASDPNNLEVRLQISSSLNKQEIEAISNLPQVGFCIPATRLLATSAMLARTADAPSSEKEETALVPTGEGDPWLARYGQPVPKDGELVLSWQIAEKLQLNTGDSMVLMVSRRVHGNMEHAAKECRVVGIMPRESGAGPRTCVPLSTIVAVEEYLEKSRDSLDEDATGGVELSAVYHGVVAFPADLPEKMRAGLWGQDCPFFEQRPYAEGAEDAEPNGGMLHFNTAQFVDPSRLRRLYSRSKMAGGSIWFWNPPATVSFEHQGARVERQVDCIPQPVVFKPEPVADMVLLSGDAEMPERLVVEVRQGDNVATLPLQVRHDPQVPAGQFRASCHTLGVMYQACQKGVRWDEEKQRMQMGERLYARLRLYARTIDDVEPLVAELQKRSLPSTGNIGEIARVRILNDQLGSIFSLMAGIGIAGAGLSLALSLIHNTRKRRKNYAVLATLGLSRPSLALFPVWESILLTTVALSMALGAFHGMGAAIDYIFASDLSAGESLCRLSWQKHVLAYLVGLLAAALASWAAAWSVLREQPAAAIRE